jgi:hypothetical protein
VTSKRSRSSKSIKFASPIKQSSPPIKSSLLLCSSCIKLGEFACQIEGQNLVQTPAIENSIASVLASRVFGRIRNLLNSNSNSAQSKPTCRLPTKLSSTSPCMGQDRPQQGATATATHKVTPPHPAQARASQFSCWGYS